MRRHCSRLHKTGEWLQNTAIGTIYPLAAAKHALHQDKIYKEKGQTVQEERYETGAAWNRCDPYEYFTRIKQRCEKNSYIERIALEFDHSINGGPFYRIIDERDVCELEYKPFSHNEWIKLPGEAPIVGYPLKDNYRY